MHALKITNLSKVYPNGTKAVKGIDLSIEQGDCFGFLGVNGAGKSTVIGIVASLIQKTEGSIEIFGNNLDVSLEAVKRSIGLVPQEMNFNIFETVINVLSYQAGYYGITRTLAQERSEYILKKLDLWPQRNTMCMYLSGGMKRRLMIARALVPLLFQPVGLLILDEPTAGVDIELRRIIWDLIKELNQQGMTVLLTTHYLEEAEYLCKNIAIIDQGVIIERTSVRQLLNRMGNQTFICDLKNSLVTLPNETLFQIRSMHPQQIEVDLKANQTVNQLFKYLEKHTIEVVSMRNKVNRLETSFLHLIHNNGATV